MSGPIKNIASSLEADNLIIDAARETSTRTKNVLTWGLPTIDNSGRAPLGGEVFILLAKSGNMKTTFTKHFMRHWSKQLMAENAKSKVYQCGFIIKYEEGIEQTRMSLWEQHSFDYSDIARGNVNEATAIAEASKQLDHPIYFIGAARKKAVVTTHSFDGVDTTVMDISNAIDKIVSAKSADGRDIYPAFMIVDYLQRVKPQGKWSSRNEQVAMASEQIIGITKSFNLRTILAAQAHLKDGENSIPSTDKVEWSGDAAQDADGIIAFKKPSNDNSFISPKIVNGKLISGTGTTIEIGGKSNLTATQNMIVARVRKMRATYNLEGQTFPIWFNKSGDATECSPYGQTQYMPTQAWFDGDK